MNRVLIFLAGCVIFAGCRKASTPPAVIDETLLPTIQRYYVAYYQSGDSTVMNACLLPEKQPVNGSTFFEITDDSAILANGKIGEGRLSLMTRVWKANRLPEVEFLYTRREFQFVNRARRSDVGDVAFDSTAPSRISLEDTTHFTCLVSPLQADEKVYLWFMKEPVPGAYDSPSGMGLELTDGNVLLNPHMLQSGKPGKYKMQLKRERVLPLQEPDHTAGGTIEVTLITEERDVILY